MADKGKAIITGDQLDSEIRQAMASSPALSKDQDADIARLRQDIRRLVGEGDMRGAKACQAEAFKIIKTGAPMKE